MLAPAKINLFLHITGKRPDGYHCLESLISFADIGDEVTLEAADDFILRIDGPFAGQLPETSDNLISDAFKRLSAETGHPLNVAVTLTKNLPIGAGIGGGSADAAAAIRLLLKHWNIFVNEEVLNPFLLSIGADVPVCFANQTSFVSGIGEVVEPMGLIEPIPALIVNPGSFLSTPEVFKQGVAQYSHPIKYIVPTSKDELMAFLKAQHNDLEVPAIACLPVINEVLRKIQEQQGCEFARMSGSGATCFGLFETKEQADLAGKEIRKQHPEWWVQSCFIGK